MILPKKHLMLDESIMGFGGFLLNLISNKMSIDELWKKYQVALQSRIYTVSFGFDRFILTLDYLHMIGAIEIDDGGGIIFEAN